MAGVAGFGAAPSPNYGVAVTVRHIHSANALFFNGNYVLRPIAGDPVIFYC